MKILIVGTGALATLFGARFREAGREVTMLGTWKVGLAALRAHGARLIDAAGREHSYAVHVADDPAACRGTTHALVLVKAWQTARSAQQLADCLAGNGVAVSLQNGLGNREALTEKLGVDRVALGVTTSGATLLGPGLARSGGEGEVWIENHPVMPDLVAALRQAGFETTIVADAESLVWGKLTANAAINPLSAILRVTNGELIERPSARELMRDLARETSNVAAACGVSLPFADPVAHAERVALQTAANRSSMLQDVRRGAPTEIDAICGAIAQLGEAHGVPTPANALLWRLVKAAVERNRNGS